MGPDPIAGAAIDAAQEQADLAEAQHIRAGTRAISTMALVVGRLGMTNTMAMSLFWRIREIGVVRTLCWRRRLVLQVIVRESFVLSRLGGSVPCGRPAHCAYGLKALSLSRFIRLSGSAIQTSMEDTPPLGHARPRVSSRVGEADSRPLLEGGFTLP